MDVAYRFRLWWLAGFGRNRYYRRKRWLFLWRRSNWSPVNGEYVTLGSRSRSKSLWLDTLGKVIQSKILDLRDIIVNSNDILIQSYTEPRLFLRFPHFPRGMAPEWLPVFRWQWNDWRNVSSSGRFLGAGRIQWPKSLENRHRDGPIRPTCINKK